jgi:hypothetical protein
MTPLAFSPVTIQTSAQSVPSMPSWFGEVTTIAHLLAFSRCRSCPAAARYLPSGDQAREKSSPYDRGAITKRP